MKREVSTVTWVSFVFLLNLIYVVWFTYAQVYILSIINYSCRTASVLDILKSIPKVAGLPTPHNPPKW